MKTKRTILCGILTAALCLAFIACGTWFDPRLGSGGGDGGGNNSGGNNPGGGGGGGGDGGVNYTLGQTGPGGGKIFYHDPAGFTVQMVNPAQNYTAHYLEAAPANMATMLAWTTTGNMVNIAGTSAGIGDGRKNTALIVASRGANAPAAKACDDYSNNGRTDWFLPSRFELEQLYVNRDEVGNLGTYTYWSSSQDNSTPIAYAWLHFFSSSTGSTGIKDDEVFVRAIRAF